MKKIILIIYILNAALYSSYAQPSSLDSTFGINGKVTSSIGDGAGVNSIAIQSDGKIVVAGSCQNMIGLDSFNASFALIRYNSNGSLDNTFGSNGKVTTDFGIGLEWSNSVAIQSDGKIVVVGVIETNVASYIFRFALVRYNSNGSLDNTFGSSGKITTIIGSSDLGNSVAIQNDGKIVMAGESYNGVNHDFALIRYNSDGSLDHSFGSTGKITTSIGSGGGRSVAIQSDGKIIVAGGNDNFALIRYNSNGAIDSTFGSGGKVTTTIGNASSNDRSIAIRNDGKILVAGSGAIGSKRVFGLACYNTDGSLDSTFSSDGKVSTDVGIDYNFATAVATQNDGKIVVTGLTTYENPYDTDFALVRYNSDGSLDSSLDSDGIVITDFGGADCGNSVAIQSDGEIVVAGESTSRYSSYIAVARYNNSYTPPPSPATIAIAAGLTHSLFICNNATIMSCGNNISGRLGDGTTTNKLTPVPVNSLNNIISISGGAAHSLFLKNDGTVWACGSHYYGVLGDGTNIDKSTPVQISLLSSIIGISAGFNHSVFLKNDGTVWACGYNNYAQLGDGTTTSRSLPIQVSSLSSITAISAGYEHTLFLKNDGTVWACGTNSSGELGDGSTFNKSIPVQVSSLTGITAIAAGANFSLFLKNDGTVWACGNNALGQLGQGTAHTSTPIQVSSLSDITSISAKNNHSIFLKNDGSVWVCGRNNYGELGDGTTVNKLTPVQASSLSGITSIAAGGLYSLFLKNNGTVWACGNNSYGQLGDGTNVNKSTPVQVIGLCMTCAPPPAPTVANATLCANNAANLSAIGTGILGWYNQAIGGTYLGGGANYTTPILNTTTTYYVQDSTCAASVTRKAVIVTVNPLPTITANASATNVCAGASVTLTGGGASSYTWTGGVTNDVGFIPSNTTTYTVTGTDGNNCSNTATKTIHVNPLPTVTANASASNLCTGSPVTLTGGGASSYTWSGGVTDGVGFIPIVTTTYTVTGTDGNNCSNTATKTIQVNPLPTVTANASATIVCAGTSITLSGDGASSYTWSGGVTNGVGFVPAGTTTYTVTGTDGNNCSNSATKTITVNPLPTVTATASATNVCEGTTVTLTGGGAASYTWSDGITNGLAFVSSTTTTYTVTGTDGNNCSNTATKTITVTPLLDLTTSLSGLTISANQNGAIYQWLNCNNGNSVIAGATSQSYPALINGNYAVLVKMNSCSDTSTCVNVSITGIEKTVENNIQLNVFPNPGNGSITIQSINEGNYTIKNEAGQMIQTFKLNTSNNYTINIENLSNGIYFIVGLNGNQMINQKVVVAK